MTLRDAYVVPYLWERTIYGIDFSFLGDDAELGTYERPHHHTHYLHPGSVAAFLGEPEPLVVVDLAEIDHPNDIATSFAVTRTIPTAG